jgi:DNA polymerase-4
MNPPSSRRIMHVDMNAFFASVEQQCNPRLRGKPVAVIGSNKRTIITTASYEARAFGIKTGLTVPEAKKLCPHLILVTGDNKKYTDTCAQLISIYKNYTPVVEVFSVDEAFLDIAGSTRLFGGEEKMARLLKEEIREKLGLTCSVGIAPNKLLAKLASDQQKPDGLVTIRAEEVPSLLEDLPVKELCGIGPHLEQYLTAMGIKTCGELGRKDPALLKSRFGLIGEKLHFMGLGMDDSPVTPLEEEEEVKSVGHSMTLEKDIWDRNLISLHILQLSEMVGRRLRAYGYQGRTVALTIRYADFTTFTKQCTLKDYIAHSTDIYQTALRILSSIRLEQAVRLLGVSISNLCKRAVQLCLFEEGKKKGLATQAMDEINGRYGEFTVTWGTLLLRYRHSGVISPSWRPEG